MNKMNNADFFLIEKELKRYKITQIASLIYQEYKIFHHHPFVVLSLLT